MYFHKAQQKPELWGSFADRQYSIWRNLEDIYGCNHESEVLIIPSFWGFPLLDYSKYGNHGTNHGATYKDGSLDFDGGDDYVDVTGVTTGTSYTMSAWGKISSGGGYIIDSETGRVLLGMNTGYTSMGFFDGTWHQGSTNILDNTLHYFVATGSTDDKKLYINNILEIFETSGSKSIGSAVAIGSRYDGTAMFWPGTIDEVRVSNVARSADQIALFYERPWDLYQRVTPPIWSIPAAPPAGNSHWYYEMIGRE